jgi:phospholipid/cholesterol/gamma-HCH transport system permease protein
VSAVVTSALRTSGSFFAFTLSTLRAMPRRPFAWRELIEQAWLLARVTVVPAVVVAVPFGAVITLQLGGLTRQLGAQPLTNSAAVLGIVRETAPIVTALLVGGAVGAAICADLGARKAGSEIDAIVVLGIDPVQRLVVPRVLAAMGVAVLVNGIVSAAGVAGGYLAAVVLQGGSASGYLGSAGALAQLPDLYAGAAKALVFGFLAAAIAAHLGLSAADGPKGIAEAVASSVLIGVVLLFAVNSVLSAAYFQLVPPRGT